MYYLFWNLEKTYEVKKRVIFIFDCNCTISDCHLWTIYIFVQKFLVNNIILNSVCVYIYRERYWLIDWLIDLNWPTFSWIQK